MRRVVALVAGIAQVIAQQVPPQPAALPFRPQLTTDAQIRLVWLANVLRELDRDGSLQRIIRDEARSSDASISESLLARIVLGLLHAPQESSVSQDSATSKPLEAAHGRDEGYGYGRQYKNYDDDDSSDDSSDDDSSDDDSSDDDSSDDYKHRHKRHKKHKKCKHKKHKKKKKDTKEESNVFSKIRGVIIGSTFTNVDITGGNASAPETPTSAPPMGNVPGGLGLGLNAPVVPGGIGPGALGSGVLPGLGGGVLPGLGTGVGPGVGAGPTIGAGIGAGAGAAASGPGSVPGTAAPTALGAQPPVSTSPTGVVTPSVVAATPVAASATPVATETPATEAPATEAPATEAPTASVETPTEAPAPPETPTEAPTETPSETPASSSDAATPNASELSTDKSRRISTKKTSETSRHSVCVLLALVILASHIILF